MKGYKVEIIPDDNEGDIQEGLCILARIIAREAISDRLAKCGVVSQENQIEDVFQNARPVEKVAGM